MLHCRPVQIPELGLPWTMLNCECFFSVSQIPTEFIPPSLVERRRIRRLAEGLEEGEFSEEEEEEEEEDSRSRSRSRLTLLSHSTTHRGNRPPFVSRASSTTGYNEKESDKKKSRKESKNQRTKRSLRSKFSTMLSTSTITHNASINNTAISASRSLLFGAACPDETIKEKDTDTPPSATPSKTIANPQSITQSESSSEEESSSSFSDERDLQQAPFYRMPLSIPTCLFPSSFPLPQSLFTAVVVQGPAKILFIKKSEIQRIANIVTFERERNHDKKRKRRKEKEEAKQKKQNQQDSEQSPPVESQTHVE